MAHVSATAVILLHAFVSPRNLPNALRNFEIAHASFANLPDKLDPNPTVAKLCSVFYKLHETILLTKLIKVKLFTSEVLTAILLKHSL